MLSVMKQRRLGFAVLRDEQIIGYLRREANGYIWSCPDHNLMTLHHERDKCLETLLEEAIMLEKFEDCWMLACIPAKQNAPL